jgi:hypothetical protein
MINLIVDLFFLFFGGQLQRISFFPLNTRLFVLHQKIIGTIEKLEM